MGNSDKESTKELKVVESKQPSKKTLSRIALEDTYPDWPEPLYSECEKAITSLETSEVEIREAVRSFVSSNLAKIQSGGVVLGGGLLVELELRGGTDNYENVILAFLSNNGGGRSFQKKYIKEMSNA